MSSAWQRPVLVRPAPSLCPSSSHCWPHRSGSTRSSSLRPGSWRFRSLSSLRLWAPASVSNVVRVGLLKAEMKNRWIYIWHKKNEIKWIDTMNSCTMFVNKNCYSCVEYEREMKYHGISLYWYFLTLVFVMQLSSLEGSTWCLSLWSWPRNHTLSLVKTHLLLPRCNVHAAADSSFFNLFIYYLCF